MQKLCYYRRSLDSNIVQFVTTKLINHYPTRVTVYSHSNLYLGVCCCFINLFLIIVSLINKFNLLSHVSDLLFLLTYWFSRNKIFRLNKKITKLLHYVAV